MWLTSAIQKKKKKTYIFFTILTNWFFEWQYLGCIDKFIPTKDIKHTENICSSSLACCQVLLPVGCRYPLYHMHMDLFIFFAQIYGLFQFYFSIWWTPHFRFTFVFYAELCPASCCSCLRASRLSPYCSRRAQETGWQLGKQTTLWVGCSNMRHWHLKPFYHLPL